MSKYYRYIIYMLIGVMIYYFAGAEENPEVLDGFRKTAPMIIVVLVIALMIVKYIRSKNEGNQEDQQ